MAVVEIVQSLEDCDLVRTFQNGNGNGNEIDSLLLVQAAAEILLNEWPRGGPRSLYEKQIVQTEKQCSLPCSFLLIRREDGQLLG
jgi:hypothetical protein